MRTRIQKSGNGLGLSLPAGLLQACGLGTEATVRQHNQTLVVGRTPRERREGWAEAVRQMGERGDDLRPEFLEWERMRKEWKDQERRWPRHC